MYLIESVHAHHIRGGENRSLKMIVGMKFDFWQTADVSRLYLFIL